VVQNPQEDVFVWRVEMLTSAQGVRKGADAHSPPMVMVGRTDAILFMNEAARALTGQRVNALDRRNPFWSPKCPPLPDAARCICCRRRRCRPLPPDGMCSKTCLSP